VSLGDYRGRIGEEIGVSRWFELDQTRIDRFADVTEDWQYIHIDRDAASNSPFGGTIAHGYLTLSLLTAMADDAMPRIDGIAMAVNYGMNNVRFLAPVRSGARVRGRFKLVDVAARGPGEWRSTLGVSVEIEGEIKPALVGEWVTLAFVAPS
jgi:acyl dehydratase